MNYTTEELLRMVDDKIDYGNKLVKLLEDKYEIDGVKKLQRKIRQEIEFLQRVRIIFNVNAFFNLNYQDQE